MTDYHEPWEALSEDDRDIHRALMSLKEEIEAVDWYHQRAVLCADAQLRAILLHNRDEEVEHAAMALEWLRRKLGTWDDQLRAYLFTTRDIIAVEEEATAPSQATPSLPRGLGIGKLEGEG